MKSTKTNSLTGHSGATKLPSIGNSFMYIETSSNNHGQDRVFVSWERTDINQISNITFYHNRFSILNIDSKKSMGRFRIQLLLEIILGARNITYLKFIDTVFYQLNGRW